MWVFSCSTEGLILVLSIIAVAVFVVGYLVRVWVRNRQQRATMERLSGVAWDRFGSWSSQVVGVIEADHAEAKGKSGFGDWSSRVVQEIECATQEEDEEPTLDMQ